MCKFYQKDQNIDKLAKLIDLKKGLKQNKNIKISWGTINMKSERNFCLNILKKVAEKTLSDSANSTSCMIYYQPKAPEALKNFSKIENDK